MCSPEVGIFRRIVEVTVRAAKGRQHLISQAVVIQTLGFVAHQPMDGEGVGGQYHLLTDNHHQRAVGEPHHVFQVGGAKQRFLEAQATVGALAYHVMHIALPAYQVFHGHQRSGQRPTMRLAEGTGHKHTQRAGHFPHVVDDTEGHGVRLTPTAAADHHRAIGVHLLVGQLSRVLVGGSHASAPSVGASMAAGDTSV